MIRRAGEGAALILASGSPRRAEILRSAGFSFAVHPMDVDESVPEGTLPRHAAGELARRKARAAAARWPEAVILASDTLVAPGALILGKPADEADAERMLRLLSGRSHTVYTGVCVCGDGREVCEVLPTEVEFLELSTEQIRRYIATGEPMDKAGAYAIQGRGGMFIRRICGDYYAVMGLPLSRTAQILEEFSIFPE